MKYTYFLISLFFLFFIGCSGKNVIKQTQIHKFKIPPPLLELDFIAKPEIKNEADIINAYTMLFLEYKKCYLNIQKIKNLQED